MTADPPNFRSLVLPREHGSWSLALEPVALGLLIAPTLAGGCLALAATAGFLVRRPLKLALTLPASEPRRAAATRWTMLLAALALVALWSAATSHPAAPTPAAPAPAAPDPSLRNTQVSPVAPPVTPATVSSTPPRTERRPKPSEPSLRNTQVSQSGGLAPAASLAADPEPTFSLGSKPSSAFSARPVPWSRVASGNLRITQGVDRVTLWPLLLALPFGAAFLWFDRRGEMRAAEAELCGSAAFAVLPAAFATLAGWPAAPALVLAGLMLARSLPTVLVVRAYLRAQKGRPPARAAAWFTAFVSLCGPLAAVSAGLAPFAVAPLAGVLFGRAAWLLSPWRPDWPARRVGVLEAFMGALWLLGLTFAYHGA